MVYLKGRWESQSCPFITILFILRILFYLIINAHEIFINSFDPLVSLFPRSFTYKLINLNNTNEQRIKEYIFEVRKKGGDLNKRLERHVYKTPAQMQKYDKEQYARDYTVIGNTCKNEITQKLQYKLELKYSKKQ
jgi:hypothetical protein